jgi:hypothetical protein
MQPEHQVELERHRITRVVDGHYLRVDILAYEMSCKGVHFSFSPTAKECRGKKTTRVRNLQESFLLHFSKMLLDADTWCQDFRAKYNAANKEAWVNRNDKPTE